jgi:hypothetical protein
MIGRQRTRRTSAFFALACAPDRAFGEQFLGLCITLVLEVLDEHCDVDGTQALAFGEEARAESDAEDYDAMRKRSHE